MTIQGYNLSAILNGIVKAAPSRICINELMKSIGLKEADFENKKEYFDWQYLAKGFEQARLLTHNEHIGAEAGKTFPPIGFGPELGFFLQVCPDIATAAKEACKAGEIIGGITKFSYKENNYNATITYKSINEWLSKMPESYRVCAEFNTSASMNIVKFLSQGVIFPHTILFEHPEQKGMKEAYQNAFGENISFVFSQSESGIVFHTEKMKMKNPLFDENAFKQHLAQLEIRKQQVTQELSFSAKTLLLLKEHFAAQNQELNIEDVANHFHFSTRVLQRHFEKENTTWSEIKNQVKKDWIIANFDYFSIGQMCDALGFSNQGNFSRWFKSIFGVSPAHYRKYLVKNS
jgi:AraC-like DNA-binding protein